MKMKFILFFVFLFLFEYSSFAQNGTSTAAKKAARANASKRTDDYLKLADYYYKKGDTQTALLYTGLAKNRVSVAYSSDAVKKIEQQIRQIKEVPRYIPPPTEPDTEEQEEPSEIVENKVVENREVEKRGNTHTATSAKVNHKCSSFPPIVIDQSAFNHFRYNNTAEGSFTCGLFYYQNKVYSEAIPFLKQAISWGSTQAMFLMAYMHYEGSATQDYNLARQYYEMAISSAGHITVKQMAMCNLGVMYYYGTDATPASRAKAREYYEGACNGGQGNTTACDNIKNM